MGGRDLMAGVATMTSREIAELTGKNHSDVMRDIRNMLEGLGEDQSSFADIFFDSYNRPQPCFKLPQDETICLMTGYDPKARMAVIKRWKELESGAVALTDPLANLPAEQRALVAVMLDNASIKRVQAEQAASIVAIEQRVEQAAETHLMLVRPSASESIVHIRQRINKKYGIPCRIVDEVIRQSPYAPKPAGMVKNGHENAQGGSYAVYWTKDINAVFARFVSECRRETTTQVSHPLIVGKFKLNGVAQ
jgi:phage regulator Rha-like protein